MSPQEIPEFFKTIKWNDGVARAIFRDLVARDSLVPGYFMPKAVFDDDYLGRISCVRAENQEWARLAGFRIVSKASGKFAVVSIEYHYPPILDKAHYIYRVIGAEGVQFVRGRLESELRAEKEKRGRRESSDSHLELEAVR